MFSEINNVSLAVIQCRGYDNEEFSSSNVSTQVTQHYDIILCAVNMRTFQTDHT